MSTAGRGGLFGDIESSRDTMGGGADDYRTGGNIRETGGFGGARAKPRNKLDALFSEDDEEEGFVPVKKERS